MCNRLGGVVDAARSFPFEVSESGASSGGVRSTAGCEVRGVARVEMGWKIVENDMCKYSSGLCSLWVGRGLARRAGGELVVAETRYFTSFSFLKCSSLPLGSLRVSYASL